MVKVSNFSVLIYFWEVTTEQQKVSAAETFLSFHNNIHIFSLKSTDCFHKMFTKTFGDSDIVSKISLVRTNTEAILGLFT